MVWQAQEKPPVKADLAIYINMLGVPGQYNSVALMLGYKLDSSFCANKDSFCRDSHICRNMWLIVVVRQEITLPPFSWFSTGLYRIIFCRLRNRSFFGAGSLSPCSSVFFWDSIVAIRAVPIQIWYRYRSWFLQYQYQFVHCSLTPI